MTELVDDIINEKNFFKNLGIENIWIEDHLFDDKDPELIVNVSKKIIDEITPDLFLDFENYDDGIDFTTDSQLVEGNDTNVNRDTEPFVDFTITDLQVVESDDDNIETIDTTIDDDIIIPNKNEIGRDTGRASRKRIITSHLNQAVRAA